MEELSDLHKRGNTIIMVTHNPRLTSYASRVITMLDGKIDTDTLMPMIEAPAVTPKRPLGAKIRKKKAVVKKKPAVKKATPRKKKA